MCVRVVPLCVQTQRIEINAKELSSLFFEIGFFDGQELVDLARLADQ